MPLFSRILAPYPPAVLAGTLLILPFEHAIRCNSVQIKRLPACASDSPTTLLAVRSVVSCLAWRVAHWRFAHCIASRVRLLKAAPRCASLVVSNHCVPSNYGNVLDIVCSSQSRYLSATLPAHHTPRTHRRPLATPLALDHALLPTE